MRVLLNAIRVLVYAITLVVLAAVAVLIVAPDRYDEFGRSMQASAVEAQGLRFAQSVNARAAGTRTEAEDIDAWLHDLASVCKLDSASTAKRYALRRATDLAVEHGDSAAALRYAREAVAFDPLDVDAVAILGRLLLGAAATRAEGLERLRKLRRRIPDHEVVVTSLVPALVDSGRPAEAASAMLDASRARHSGMWHVQWGPDPVAQAATLRPYALGDGRIELACTLDDGCAFLRIGLPRGFFGRLSAVEFGLDDEALRSLAVAKPRWISIVDGAVQPETGLSGQAGFELAVVRKASFRLRIRARLDARIPNWLRGLEQRIGARIQAALGGRDAAFVRWRAAIAAGAK